jgi:hypothetical protein
MTYTNFPDSLKIDGVDLIVGKLYRTIGFLKANEIKLKIGSIFMLTGIEIPMEATIILTALYEQHSIILYFDFESICGMYIEQIDM